MTWASLEAQCPCWGSAWETNHCSGSPIWRQSHTCDRRRIVHGPESVEEGLPHNFGPPKQSCSFLLVLRTDASPGPARGYVPSRRPAPHPGRRRGRSPPFFPTWFWEVVDPCAVVPNPDYLQPRIASLLDGTPEMSLRLVPFGFPYFRQCLDLGRNGLAGSCLG